MSSYGLWLSAAGMKVNEHRQTLLTNNMANAQTTGFKHDLAVVMQRQVESQASGAAPSLAHPVLDALPGGLNVRPTYQSFAQGPIEKTGNPLDVAVDGKGFFAVSDGNVTRYTRDGEMTTNAAGQLVLSSGGGVWRMLDDGKTPIIMEEELGAPRIDSDGTVRQGDTTVARLGLWSPQNEQTLRKVGQNLFESTDKVPMTPADGRFVGGAREAANFNIMEGLASMIEVSRAYRLNATMLQLQDEVTGQAAQRIGRVA